MHIYYYFSVNDKIFTDATVKISGLDKSLKFSGIAYGRSKYFKKASFHSISYLSDIELNGKEVDQNFLTKVETDYDILVSDAIHMERHFWRFSKHKRVLFAQEIVKQILKDYESSNFDVVFSEGIDDFTSYFLYKFSKEKNIPFYYYVYARLGSGVFLSNSTNTGPVSLNEKFKQEVNNYCTLQGGFEETKDFVNKYIKDKKQPYYVSDGSMLYKVFSFNDFKRLYLSFKRYLNDKETFHAYENPLVFPFKRLHKITRKTRYKRYFKNSLLQTEDLKNQEYFIYPLHFHPEAATLIQGRWLNDQKVIIEMISKALPSNVMLVVKEHKVSIGRRPLQFYRQIDKYHNVRFVDESSDVYSLIQNSKGVVTISSSMGLEAILLNKPVITFGDIHYNILSDVIKVRDISLMKEYVKKALNFSGYNESEYWAFMKVITSKNYKMPGYSPHNYVDEHVDAVVEMIHHIKNKTLQ